MISENKMMMKNPNIVPPLTKDFLLDVQGGILVVYGKYYSLEQIQEAHAIAFLVTDVFRDYITKLQRKRYCDPQI
jgi:hypothetical protein